MKKLVILVMVVGLLLGGCAGLQNTGQDVEKFVCNPPAAVVNLVNLGEPFILTALSAAVPGSAAYVQAFEAFGGMTSIQSMGCATVKQINALIALLGSPQTTKGLKLAGKPAFDVTPLAEWRDGKK